MTGALASRPGSHDFVSDHRGPEENGQGGGSTPGARRHQVGAAGNADSGLLLLPAVVVVAVAAVGAVIHDTGVCIKRSDLLLRGITLPRGSALFVGRVDSGAIVNCFF